MKFLGHDPTTINCFFGPCRLAQGLNMFKLQITNSSAAVLFNSRNFTTSQKDFDVHHSSALVMCIKSSRMEAACHVQVTGEYSDSAPNTLLKPWDLTSKEVHTPSEEPCCCDVSPSFFISVFLSWRSSCRGGQSLLLGLVRDFATPNIIGPYCECARYEVPETEAEVAGLLLG